METTMYKIVDKIKINAYKYKPFAIHVKYWHHVAGGYVGSVLPLISLFLCVLVCPVVLVGIYTAVRAVSSTDNIT